jgi:molybdopterin/thiamine biosynthesis adenylyltransferase
MSNGWTLTVSGAMYADLCRHLFSGHHDEHGAVIAAGVAHVNGGMRLLGRELMLARDGVDYVAGERGYRMLTANFVRDSAIRCRDSRLAYIAVHNHGGIDAVAFSPDDMASHERGYPALVAMMRGQPVGGLVMTTAAAAGDLWLADGRRVEMREMVILGRPIQHLTSSTSTAKRHDPQYDRQARLFGDVGQVILGDTHVGVIGAGGVGLMLIEYLSRLGVGHITTVDPERLDPTNVPRMPGTTLKDAEGSGANKWWPPRIRFSSSEMAAPKVHLAERLAREANPKCDFRAIQGDFLDPDNARAFLECDYLFLAADSMSARLLFNAMTQQYLIPGAQIGSKIEVDRDTGMVIQAFSVVRPISFDGGCLWCNGLIPPARLQLEGIPEEQRKAQRYVDDPLVAVPSVITLNAIGASLAANEFLFRVTGLAKAASNAADYTRIDALKGDILRDEPSSDPACPECGGGPDSRRARGDALDLPTTQKRSFIQ